MLLQKRLAQLEELASATHPNVDTSWTRHPAVQPILAELQSIPLSPPPPCHDPLRASPNAIAAAASDPNHGAQVQRLFCRLADVMCQPDFPKTWIPRFDKPRR